MAKGKQTDEQTVYNIMVSYALTKNYSETSRQLNIPRKTVEKTVKENKDKEEYAELCRHKKEEFSEECSEIIGLLLSAARQKAEMLNKNKKLLARTKMTEISTSIGTLYDKRALNDGESTDNITFTMPDGVKKYAE